MIFPPAAWEPDGHQYSPGDTFTYKGAIYRVRQGHVTQPGQTPTVAHSLYEKHIEMEDPRDLPQWRADEG